MLKEVQFTLSERTHKRAQVVRLLEPAFADFDDVRQVLTDLREELASDAPLTEEQTVQRIRVLRALLLKRLEVLEKQVSSYVDAMFEV